jgi:hypothetical protein
MLKQPLPFISSDIDFIITKLVSEMQLLLKINRFKEALEKMAVV